MDKIRGNAFVFGHNIDTDQIFPGRYLELVDSKEIAAHCLEGADPTLLQRLSPGDVIVAGRNFGCGSSREHAAITLVNAGIGAVVAESFARIFYRNAINLGLAVLVCSNIIQKINEGDNLDVNLEEGLIKNLSTGEQIQGEKMSHHAMGIIFSGGIKPYFLKITQQMP